MADEKPAVSFIGLGAMGFGMATHLLKQGYAVTGFDVWAPTLERFKAAGGLTAATPSEAVAGKPFCICMVATAQQAQSVLLDGADPAVPALPQGAALLLCSTVPCDYVQSLEKQLQARGRGDIFLVDAPVSGGAARAADGTLSIMAGMSDAALAKARPLLAEMSDPNKLYIVEGGIGAGSNMKMVHQVLAACQILSVSEAMGFADRLGLDLARAQKLVLESDAWNWFFEHRSARILTQFQPVASAIQIVVKDAGIITAEGRRRGVTTLMTGVAEQAYFTAMGRGYALDDDSSLIRLYNEGKGNAEGLAKTEEEKVGLVVDLLRGIILCSAAESLSFAHAVGLDLDQVFELCINAAGASTVLKEFGPKLIDALRAGSASKTWAATEGETCLKDFAEKLQTAMEEAQRIKVPLFLGNQALNILRQALQYGSVRLSVGAVVNIWGAKHWVV
ncbi:3-hydroxyisobutyrate mitochondrial [Madurella fahalii]|uniref:3-hydroxyisobutyrate mitochondrial n=1 Tax=Madurella fahalii TaxID=1157608 RepID=A0ABQ0GN09_9PEZI